MTRRRTDGLYTHLARVHGITYRRMTGRERHELQWLDDVLHGHSTMRGNGLRIRWPKYAEYVQMGYLGSTDAR